MENAKLTINYSKANTNDVYCSLEENNPQKQHSHTNTTRKQRLIVNAFIINI